MKIAISGKGGTGKTTVAAGLARHFADSGRRVIAVDADCDANLAAAVGGRERRFRAYRHEQTPGPIPASRICAGRDPYRLCTPLVREMTGVAASKLGSPCLWSGMVPKAKLDHIDLG